MSSNYLERLQNIIIQRTSKFFLKKFVVGIVLYYIFTKFTQLSIFIRLFNFNYNFFIFDYVKIFILSILLDSIKILSFQRYELFISAFQNIIKIALEPNVQTLFLFSNTILTAMILQIIENNINKNSKKCSYHLIVYGIYNSVNFIFRKSNFNWPEVYINEFDALKYKLRKFSKKLIKIILQNTLIFLTVLLIERLIFSDYTIEIYFIFIFSTLFYETINYLSFSIIKYTICKPINYNNSPENLILINYKFDQENRFNNIHFLNDIYYSYLSLLNSSKLMDYNKNPFNSKDYIDNLIFKIHNISQSLESKIKESKSRFENYERFNFFMSLDIFKDNTSIEILDIISKIITVSISILYKIRNPNYNVKEHSELYLETIQILINQIIDIENTLKITDNLNIMIFIGENSKTMRMIMRLRNNIVNRKNKIMNYNY